MMKIWERYFIYDVVKLFVMLLATFYFLYVVVDYSTNSSDFAEKGMGVLDLALFYLFQFSKRLDVLLPFSLMIATMRTLCTLNTNNELVALAASGVSLKRLGRPFLVFGLVCVALLYANLQWGQPEALNGLKAIKKTNRKHLGVEKKQRSVSSFVLKDGSTLLYQGYDTTRERFFDVYWVYSPKEIFRAQYLYPDELHSIGTLVDRLVRKDNGKFHIAESHSSLVFNELGFTDDILGKALSKPSRLSITQLWSEVPPRGKLYTDHDVLVLSNLHYKLSLPWLAILVVIAPMPFCMRFTRHLHIFLLYGVAVVAFLIFFTILNAMQVVGESQVIPPQMSSWGTFFVFYCPALWYYIKMK